MALGWNSRPSPRCSRGPELFSLGLSCLRAKDIDAPISLRESRFREVLSVASTQTYLHCLQSMSATRLAQLLSSSPHVIAHIHNLYIGNCSVQTLTAMVQIPWSHLQAIFLVLALIDSLVSLPTLRKLAFHSMFWVSAHLHTILSRCNSRVHSLTFENCFLPTTPYDASIFPAPPNSHLPLITSLVLFGIEGDFLNYSALLVDLSRLAQVTLHQNTIPALETLLYTCRHTIQSLELNGSEHYVAALDLGAFPALSWLTLSGVDDLLPPLMGRMGEKPATVRIDAFWGRGEDAETEARGGYDYQANCVSLINAAVSTSQIPVS
ncbi:hypothetical protein C8J57DRAFT_1705908 [Mycena rebaudengoi]|nr:hypothetical protein C8J57DRAFT_1705908 [Mycena rebaudengoi]